MKVYEMKLESGNDSLLARSPNELLSELESLEIGESVKIDIIDMSNQELDNLGEFEGF